MPLRARGGQGWASLALAGLAAATVVAGLVLTGGPMQARKERRDATRESDLLALARQVECLAHAAEGRLPDGLAATATCPFSGRFADPFSGAAYGYEVLDARSWRLCAVFETSPGQGFPHVPPARDEAGCSVHHLPPPVEFRGNVPGPQQGGLR